MYVYKNRNCIYNFANIFIIPRLLPLLQNPMPSLRSVRCQSTAGCSTYTCSKGWGKRGPHACLHSSVAVQDAYAAGRIRPVRSASHETIHTPPAVQDGLRLQSSRSCPPRSGQLVRLCPNLPSKIGPRTPGLKMALSGSGGELGRKVRCRYRRPSSPASVWRGLIL